MHRTLVEMLAERSAAHPDALICRHIDAGVVQATRTHSELWADACRWAWLFKENGVKQDDVAVLALPNSACFPGAYFGALMAGAIPAPVPPFRQNQPVEIFVSGISKKIRLLDAKALVIPDSHTDVGVAVQTDGCKALTVLSRRLLPESAPSVNPTLRERDTALLQFTSGTSGTPKAVQLSHAALLSQCSGIAAALKLGTEREAAVSWLPLYHDMGLIGFLLTPIALSSGEVTFLLTEDFAFRPGIWMRMVDKYQATITGGPPSAYVLATRAVRESELERMDLRRLRVALVGAETVHPENMQKFAARFFRAGLQPGTIVPCYGLAENGLAVTITEPGRGLVPELVDRETLHAWNIARPADGVSHTRERAITSVGAPLPGTEIRIVSPEGEVYPDRTVGQVVIRSSSLMQGYYRDAEASAQVLRDGWLWTGDLGYVSHGDLYIVGRSKELLIVGGLKYDPGSVEAVLSMVPGVYNGRAVAISIEDEETGTESLVMLVETKLTERDEREILRRQLRQALVEYSFPVSEIVLLDPKLIQTTPNGKLKRLECKTRYVAGEFTGI